MKLAIMQPYFLPYVGYFHLIAAVDTFVIYDNIKYTKKGWINRNRILRDGAAVLFTLPLRHDSDHLNVAQRQLSAGFDQIKLARMFELAYRRAPNFAEVYPLIEKIIQYDDVNLFEYIYHSVVSLCQYIGIDTDIRISSELSIDHNLKNQDKVIEICLNLGADTYINMVGGSELYSKSCFDAQSILLKFLKPISFEYSQFGVPFVPGLSIIDLLMFNPIEEIRTNIREKYELI
jgi:hypothetical protein